MTSFEGVLARLEGHVSGFSADRSQERLLRQTLDIQVSRLARRENHLSFRMPLLVYAGLGREELPALDLAAAMLILYLGTDLLDDLADGDMASDWATANLSQVHLAAILFFSTFPQLILSQMDAPACTIVKLQRAVLLASVRMAAGQQADIRSREGSPSEVSLQSAWDCIEAKSGAAVALFAEAGAILADATEAAEHYADFGSALGCAFCLMKDCSNLMDAERSTDLMNGTLTYPLALHRGGLRAEESRRRFDRLLEEAKRDEGSRREVAAQLLAAGTFRITGVVIDSCRRRGFEALDRAQPLEPAGSELRRFFDFASSKSV